MPPPYPRPVPPSEDAADTAPDPGEGIAPELAALLGPIEALAGL
ncbi:hypothetical protein [Rhodophyticola porphyridii]